MENIDIDRILFMARISCTEDEKKILKNYLTSVLEAFEIIKKVDTDNIEPSYIPIKLKNRMREDNPKKSNLKPYDLTDLIEENYFIGPKTKR